MNNLINKVKGTYLTGPPDQVIKIAQCVENDKDCARIRTVTVKRTIALNRTHFVCPNNDYT